MSKARPPRWSDRLVMCLECRAGKEYLTSDQTETALLNLSVDYECERCGYTTTKEYKL